MEVIRVALVGFGHVGQALMALLESKQERLRAEFGFSTQVTGIATGHHGVAIDPEGIDTPQALRCAQKGQAIDRKSTL